MKSLVQIALFIPVMLAGCSSNCVEDSGKNITIGTVVKPFDKIKVEGAFKLVLTQDSSYQIRIQADSAIMKHVRADVSGGELKVQLGDKKYCGTDSIIVYAGIGVLKELDTEGAVKVAGEGRIYADDLKFEFSGTSNVSLDLSVRKLETKIDGVAELKLIGQAGTHDLDSKGTVKINAFDFVAGIYDIDMDGTAKANVNVLNELKVKTSGATEIYYKGNPKKVDEKKSGAAKLEKVN
ncbi:head GIN domain-containing protein [Pedobacter sp. GR22-6]|uniref:head GIN domain-containing protein n=1 Tax=Pedobacter sp. GR22-6 TaxID=3127957 RepID=UPI00307FC057